MRPHPPEPVPGRLGTRLRAAGHELRNHLQAVMTLAESAHRHREGPAGRRWLREMRATTRALLDIAEDWLGQRDVQAEFDPRRLVRDQLAVHRAGARGKAVALAGRVSRGCPGRVRGDRRAFRTLVANLVGNAVKFTPRGAVDVRLSGARIGILACLRLEVADTGPGLPGPGPADLEALGAASRRRGGSGLGLGLASEAARALGGGLVGDNVPGGGARFVAELTLPVAGQPAPSRRTRKPDARRKLRVLVVEDHPANREFARRTLTQRGHAVRGAGCARQALRLAERAAYDVALVDLGLPDRPGRALACRLRELRPQLRIIAWSGEDGAGDGAFDAWLAKPCDSRRLAHAAETQDGAGEWRDDEHAEQVARRTLRRHAARDRAELDAATRSKAAATIAAAAHRIRGALALAGHRVLADLARRAEAAAGAGRVRQAGRALAKVSDGLRRLEAGLR